jgi:hypothetical protein
LIDDMAISGEERDMIRFHNAIELGRIGWGVAGGADGPGRAVTAGPVTRSRFLSAAPGRRSLLRLVGVYSHTVVRVPGPGSRAPRLS